jgi:hypothetical protein
MSRKPGLYRPTEELLRGKLLQTHRFKDIFCEAEWVPDLLVYPDIKPSSRLDNVRKLSVC